MSQRYAIRISYDGTDFCGWQKQGGQETRTGISPSIEELVAKAVASTFQEEVPIVASGRTDAGVHASGQVAHFSVSSPPESGEHLLDALNHSLPESIRIHEFTRVPSTFSARSAVAKQYSYYFLEGPAPLPHLHRFSRWSHRSLEIDLLREAVTHLQGKHDFAPLGRSSPELRSTIREISEAEISQAPIPLPGCFSPEHYQWVGLRLRGSGFLKQMVRRIVGTLILVGEKRETPDVFREILTTQDSSRVGDTAPANGLWLDRVWYREESGFPFSNFSNEAKDSSQPFAT